MRATVVAADVPGEARLMLALNIETVEFIVSCLPADDEVTKLIARGGCALALSACPQCEYVATGKS